MTLAAILAVTLAAALTWQPHMMAASHARWHSYSRTPLLAAIAEVESAWNPRAVSPTGVKGLMQLSGIARREIARLDPRMGRLDPFDPAQAIEGASILLAYYRSLFGRHIGCEGWRLTIASYNTGPGAVGGAYRRHGKDWLEHIRDEGRRYVPRVLRAEQRYLSAGWPGESVCNG